MKLYQKKLLATGAAILLLCASLCGCGQTKEEMSAAEEPYGISGASQRDGADILSDISTTQYFTDQAVDEKDMEIIVRAGINAPSAMNSQPWHFSVITDAEVLQQISEGMGGGMGFGGAPQGGGAEGEMSPPMEGEAPEGMEFPGGGMPGGMEFPEGEMPEGMEFPEGEMPEGMEFPEGGMPGGMEFPGGEIPGAPGGSMSKAGIADAPLVIVVSCKSGSELDAGLACQNMSATAQLLGYGTKIITSPTMALNGTNQDTYRELLGIPEGYSAAAILLIGYEDTSVDTSADGYTGATGRNAAEDMVTYILTD